MDNKQREDNYLTQYQSDQCRLCLLYGITSGMGLVWYSRGASSSIPNGLAAVYLWRGKLAQFQMDWVISCMVVASSE